MTIPRPSFLPDLSRPDVVFILVWLVTPFLAYADLYYMGFSGSWPVTLLIGFNVASAAVVYRVLAMRMASRKCETVGQTPAPDQLWRAASVTFGVFVALELFIIWRSDGIPVWWRLRHEPKSYVDFGVPTLSGFANMLRVFVLCLVVEIWTRFRQRRAVILGGILLTTSVLEMARANTIFLMLCGAAIILLRTSRPTARAVVGIAAAGVVSVLLFGLAEHYRSPGGSGGEGYLKYPSILNRLPYGFTDVYLYLSTPISNLYYAANRGIRPLHYPYFTTQTILPTVLREKIYRAHLYPIALRVESFNATTFYSPFVADFGFVAAALLVLLLQATASYVHLRARRSDIFYELAYAPIFAALTLSFFYNYFLTLTVLTYPVLLLALRRSTGPVASQKYRRRMAERQ